MKLRGLIETSVMFVIAQVIFKCDDMVLYFLILALIKLYDIEDELNK